MNPREFESLLSQVEYAQFDHAGKVRTMDLQLNVGERLFDEQTKKALEELKQYHDTQAFVAKNLAENIKTVLGISPHIHIPRDLPGLGSGAFKK